MNLANLKVVVFHDHTLNQPEIIDEQLTQVGFKKLVQFIEIGSEVYNNIIQIQPTQASYDAALHQAHKIFENLDLIIKLNYFTKNQLQISELNDSFQQQFHQKWLSNFYLLKAIANAKENYLKPRYLVMINLFQKDLIDLDHNITYAAINSLFHGASSEYLRSPTQFTMINKLFYDPIVFPTKLFYKLNNSTK